MPNETISEFITALKKIAEKCKFPDLEDRLRDALVCGILNEDLQSMLLMNSMLTFKVAQEMALAHEAAVKNVAEIKDGKPREEMNVMGRAVKVRLRDEKKIFKCLRCGNTNHREEQCFFKDKRCFKCQKLGHMSRVCKNGNWRSDRNNCSIDEEAEATNGLFNVNQVKDTSNMRNYMVRVQTSGRDINMLIDSGTGKNIISEKTYIETWVKSERPRIEKDATKLVQWNRQRLSILGKIRADVKVNKRNITMELLVVEGPGPNLIGREAFDQIGIGLEWINYGDSVCQITEEFMDVFKDKLGQYRVLKRDGSIRICGDYRSTVNTIVESDTFPVPAAADLQVNLAGGKVFSKLDLKDAYQQLVVDEETAELLAINTHKGLFKVNRLPFGVSCAPGIFQRRMESLIAKIPGVVVYLDDILVTGKDEMEHDLRLREVLKSIQRMGLTLKKEKCEFKKSSLIFLGCRIDAEGIHPTEEKYRTTVLEPLHRLLNKRNCWKWKEVEDRAFREAKNLIQSDLVLTPYDARKPLVLACDASPFGVGAVLSHVEEGMERPIAFASRTMSQTERSKETPEPVDVFLMETNEESPLEAKEVAKLTQEDSVLGIIVKWTRIGWPAHCPAEKCRPYFNRRNELSLHRECLLWGNRVVIPPVLQRKTIEQLHETHPGIVQMKAIARSHVWWPGMDKAIENRVERCENCQLVRNNPKPSPVHPWTAPVKPWSRIHIDYAGPFHGRTFLIVVDSMSKWPEATIMDHCTATATVRVLRNLFAVHGLPDQVVSDNGRMFVGHEFQEFLMMNGIMHITSAPYHPQTNGQAERVGWELLGRHFDLAAGLGILHIREVLVGQLQLLQLLLDLLDRGLVALRLAEEDGGLLGVVEVAADAGPEDDVILGLEHDDVGGQVAGHRDLDEEVADLEGGLGRSDHQAGRLAVVHGQVGAEVDGGLLDAGGEGHGSLAGLRFLYVDGQTSGDLHRRHGVVEKGVQMPGSLKLIQGGLHLGLGLLALLPGSDGRDGAEDDEELRVHGALITPAASPGSITPAASPGSITPATSPGSITPATSPRQHHPDNITRQHHPGNRPLGGLWHTYLAARRHVDQLKDLTGLAVAEMVHRAQDSDGWRRVWDLLLDLLDRGLVALRLAEENGGLLGVVVLATEARPQDDVLLRLEHDDVGVEAEGGHTGLEEELTDLDGDLGRSNYQAGRLGLLDGDVHAEVDGRIIDAADKGHVGLVPIRIIHVDRQAFGGLLGDIIVEVRFLGHVISQNGIDPEPYKIDKLITFKKPEDKKSLQRIMGLYNYLGKFIPNLAASTSNIRGILRKNVVWHWGPKQDGEFDHIKECVRNAPSLAHFDKSKMLILQCDSSKDAVGAALLQEDRPLAFASASFSDSQKQYSQIEKELLSVYYGCKKFEYLLSGHTFVVQTDHQPLLPLVKKPRSNISLRLQRLVMKLLAFDFKLQYKPGKYFIVADTLSRDTHPMDELPTPFLKDHSFNGQD
ncbi:K02A2.6-like, partial [Cordylochernes scorpioides]